MKIYHTETQADYHALLIELEEQGCFWAYGGKPPTEWRDEFWEFHKGSTCVGVRSNKQMQYCGIDYYKEEYPDTPIIKYKEKQESDNMTPEVTCISDKVNRLQGLAVKIAEERKVKDEGIKDTLYDLANYAIMSIIELEREEK